MEILPELVYHAALKERKELSYNQNNLTHEKDGLDEMSTFLMNRFILQVKNHFLFKILYSLYLDAFSFLCTNRIGIV